jgi:glutathione S-transferase
MLTVWGRRNSFNLQKVMWLVGELELPHTHIPAGGSYGGLDDPAFLAMNPHGRVPVIDDDGTIVWDSQTILRYLVARYGRGRFWSDDPAERSRAERPVRHFPVSRMLPDRRHSPERRLPVRGSSRRSPQVLRSCNKTAIGWLGD